MEVVSHSHRLYYRKGRFLSLLSHYLCMHLVLLIIYAVLSRRYTRYQAPTYYLFGEQLLRSMNLLILFAKHKESKLIYADQTTTGIFCPLWVYRKYKMHLCSIFLHKLPTAYVGNVFNCVCDSVRKRMGFL